MTTQLINEDDDYVIGYAVNILERTFRLYSNTGRVKEIVCDTSREFMRIISHLESTLKKEDWVETSEIALLENP